MSGLPGEPGHPGEPGSAGGGRGGSGGRGGHGGHGASAEALRFHKWRARAATSFAVLAVCFSVGTYANQHKLSTLQGQLHRAALSQCQRVQLLRDRVNTNTGEIAKIATTLTDVTTEPGLLASLNPADRLARVASAAHLHAIIGDLRYSPPTNCQQAVEHPVTYRPPAPAPLR